ncbi:hypothetical protein LIER_34017 [Lithospermum erythrorhizon]|uniref:DUF4283 domain-containing protein n=1 Tax=Lithospermum erythrorhizon TaxID=34254 RepID=A0AAV3RZ54_LITER
MSFVIVGKFTHGKPPIDTIRTEFTKVGLRGRYNLSVLDAKHLIMEFDLEEDYTRSFIKKSTCIGANYMRLIKWTHDYYPELESPIVSVWISFPLFPLYWFDKEAIFLVASSVGRPLRIDEPSIQWKRLGVARVCIKVDVSKALPEEVWLTIVDDVTKQPKKRINQPMEY